MSLYRIQSVQTKYFVVSDGKESDGSVLATIQDSDFNPSTTVVEIVPGVDANVPTKAIVQSSKVPGLFVAYKEVDGKSFLSWTYKKFEWIINPTGGGRYHITPAGSEDLYWFDKFNVGILNHIALLPGSDVEEQENFFSITPA